MRTYKRECLFAILALTLLPAVLFTACGKAEDVPAVATVSQTEPTVGSTAAPTSAPVSTTVSTSAATTKVQTTRAVQVAKSSTANAALTEGLHTLLAPYGDRVALYYKKIATGEEYVSNPDAKFHIASICKAPYCMYLLDEASRGKVDLSAELVYSTSMKKEGSGTVKDMPDGTRLSVETLIRHTIRESDNTAFAMLRAKFGTSDYIQYTKQFNLFHPADVRNVSNGNICARDAGQYLAALYRFFGENPNGGILETHMRNTKSKYIYGVPSAQKFGNYDGCYNVIAVVYADEPYFLAVLTRDFENSRTVIALIRQITAEIQKNG